MVEVVSRHIDSLSNCLLVTCSNSSDLLLQLLCLLAIPSKLDVDRLSRLSARVIATFFHSLAACGKQFLPLDEVVASRGVYTIVSESDGRAETLLEPAK